jgi:15-cis-phytoene desaturase
MSDVIVVGAGLAGLTAALTLAKAGRPVHVFEALPHLGGRTASWTENGMEVEAGLHRFRGYYKHLPQLMRTAGIDLSRALIWVDEVEIRVPNGPSAVYGASLPRNPWGTLATILGRNQLCRMSERLALAVFFTVGTMRYGFTRARLDEVSVHCLAKACGVSQRAIDRILQAATQSTYFHSPERYSACVLFALGAKFALRLHRSGVAVFAGGMTEVLADPLAECIRRHGGTVTAGVPVQALIHDGSRVSGIKVASQEFAAKEVILATSLGRAKQLLIEAFGQTTWNKRLLDLPTMPAVGIQLELDAPATGVDRPTFAPGTCIAAIAEQSRTTFRKSKGRVSVLLAEPERFLSMPPEKILSAVCADAQRVGMELNDKILSWRLFVSPADFYFPSPGSEALRPTQQTPVRGLTLAGDYTKQPHMATMEGAVLSGKIAADVVLNRTAGSP